MNTRILHCGENLQNYYLCIEKQVVGFVRMSCLSGDTIYFCVKVNGKSLIGAKAVIDTLTNNKPWEHPKLYKFTYSVKNLEYCTPFEISGLSKFGGSYWSVKFVQNSKPIKDEGAKSFLNEQFNKNIIADLLRF